MSNRATPEVRALYEEHTRTCRHCRRMHRVVYALYEGPVVPPAPMGVREEKEFYGILRRMKDERPEPWYHKLTIRAGIGVLATAAAALTLSLFDVTPASLGFDLGDEGDLSTADGIASLDDIGPDGGAVIPEGESPSIRHHAQAYGRVVGGAGTVRPDGGDATTSNTFPVGTHFEVGSSEALQVGLLGKIIANFTPGTDVSWVTGSPSLVELQLDEGMVAIRYDREETDPILQIRTPSAVVRVVGTVFTVQVDETDDGESTTLVSVLRGQVEVMNPDTKRTIAEVESGNRYSIEKGEYHDVGRLEVQAALPISEEGLAARIPEAWHVPGLPTDPALRTLAHVPERVGDPAVTIIRGPSIRVTGTTGPDEAVAPVDPLPIKPRARKVENEGDDLIQDLMADAAAARRKELRRALEQCRDYYNSHETRYLAGPCFGKFLEKYDDHPLAAEAYLLRAILRMDYALDYKTAERDLKTYLRRAPNGRASEKAMYRLWLAATEDGRITEALTRARAYLDRYPNGSFVGKILQRFPELKNEL